MKVNELRIGNYINVGKSNMLITVGSVYDLHNISLDTVDTFNPILLTEEWFLKFGFKKETNGLPDHSDYFSYWIYDYKYSFSYATFREDWGFYHSYTDAYKEEDNNKFDFISCGIKYVHQLQNLFFALTGEELTSKEETK